MYRIEMKDGEKIREAIKLAKLDIGNGEWGNPDMDRDGEKIPERTREW